MQRLSPYRIYYTHPRTIPLSRTEAEYYHRLSMDLVSDYDQLAGDYNTLVNEHETDIKSYNNLVVEYNTLKKELIIAKQSSQRIETALRAELALIKQRVADVVDKI